MAIRRFSTSNLSGGKSSKLWDQETTPGYFESIATVIVPSAGASSITFDNIPQNYAHLQVRGILRTNAGGNLVLQFNGVTTGTGYSYHSISANGASVGANSGSSTSELVLQRAEGISSTASTFTGFLIDILDYSSSNKNKVVRSLSGVDKNGSGNIDFESGALASTTAVTSMTFTRGTLQQYSHFALYGIRGI